MQGGHSPWGDSWDGALGAVWRKQTLYRDMGLVLQHLWASYVWDFFFNSEGRKREGEGAKTHVPV